MNQVQIYYGLQNKTPKSIDPPGKPEGNTTHRMHCTLSPKIVLMSGYNTQVLAT
jgi:hypothetical protein